MPRPSALVLAAARALCAGIGLFGHARADEIQPDRPEITESARLVPRGRFQLETGLTCLEGEPRGRVPAHGQRQPFDFDLEMNAGAVALERLAMLRRRCPVWC